MAKLRHPITIEQYEHSFMSYPGLRDELINGKILLIPKPKPLHQQIRQNVERLLHSACERTGYTANGGSNIEFSASNSALAPDVFVVSVGAWEQAMQEDIYLNGPPLIAVEVLSPSKDIDERVRIYRDAEVAQVWVIDPDDRSVLVYADLRKPYREHSAIRLPAPLDASVKVDDVFAGL